MAATTRTPRARRAGPRAAAGRAAQGSTAATVGEAGVEEDAGPQESRSSASESVDPVRRFEALRELAKHLQSLASTVELEHGKRLRMPKVRAPATMLKLEDEVEELKRSRERSGDALSGLRASGALGDPVGAGFAHGNILEAAIVIAQSAME